MPVITTRSAGDFIRNAKLPSAPARRRGPIEDTPPLHLKETEAQSIVVGSSLIAAAANVPVQTREDLINCTLFAQLAASGKVKDKKKVDEWYEAYFEALGALGWAQSDRQFEDYKFSSVNVETHQAIVKVLTVLLGPSAAALTVVKTVFDALQSMNENSPWITLFDRESKVGKSARFQVATAQIEDGLLQIALVGFDLKAKAALTQVLFFKWSTKSTRLKYAAGKATIYEQALADQRAAILARLNEYRTAYVGQVAFPPPPGGAKSGPRGTKKTARRSAGAGTKRRPSA